MKGREKYLQLITVLVVSGVIAVAFLLIGSQKQSFHIDEIYTYGLANSDIFDVIDESIDPYIDGEIVQKYMTVSEENAFNFGMVVENQVEDVHPPLYYMFIHFLSSFIPGAYSKLVGLLPNILFAVIVYWQMVWLLMQFCNKKITAMLFAGFYLFTMCFTNIVVFFRMYALLTVMTNFLIMLFVKYKPWQEKTKWFYIGLFFAVIGGMQTQYYFTLIAGFACLVYAVWLLYCKKIKDFLIYVCTGLAGVGASIAIFPATIDHIFKGYRGEEAFESFASSNLINNVKAYYRILNWQLFGNLFVLVAAAVVIVWFVSSRTDKEINKKVAYILLQCTLPAVAYIFIIAKVAPYQTDRYVVNVTALLYFSVFGILFMLTEKYGKKGMLLPLVLALAVIAGSYKQGVPYLYKHNETQNNIIREMKDVPCVYVFGTSKYNCVPYYLELSGYNTVVLMAEYHSDYFDWWQYKDSDKVIVYLDTIDKNKDVLDRIVKNSPNIDGYSKLYNSSGVPVYLLD